jgi:hypothetical protein
MEIQVKKSNSFLSTEALIGCGWFVAPIFYLLAVFQLMIRPDFDIRVLPISFLSLGDLGWIQVANFIMTGALALLCARGLSLALRGEKAGTWGPILVALFGIGMIMAGVFRPDPIPGVSPGVDAGTPVAMSISGGLHMVGFFVAFPSLIAACFVFTRRFVALGQKSWAIYSVATGVAVPAINLACLMVPAWAGVFVAASGLVLFAWLAAIAAYMLARPFALAANWARP